MKSMMKAMYRNTTTVIMVGNVVTNASTATEGISQKLETFEVETIKVSARWRDSAHVGGREPRVPSAEQMEGQGSRDGTANDGHQEEKHLSEQDL